MFLGWIQNECVSIVADDLDHATGYALHAHNSVTDRRNGICRPALDAGKDCLAQLTTSFIDDLIELRIDRICLECANFDVGLVRELLQLLCENRPGHNGQQNAPKQNRWHGRRITELETPYGA